MPEISRLSLRGWEVVSLATPELEVQLVPARGASITSVRRRADGTELLWQPPWGLRHATSATLPGSEQAQLLDQLVGGWRTAFPNGGDAAAAHGVDWGFDGEAQLAAFDWCPTDTGLVLETRLVRSPFRLTKTLCLNGPRLELTETVLNAGGEPVEVMWGSSVTFGPPLLGAGTVLETDASSVHPDPFVSPGAAFDDVLPWPRGWADGSVVNLRTLPAPTARVSRMAYLEDFARGTVSLTNPERNLGVTLDWDSDVWPYLWYALEAGAAEGFPWFSAGYFLTLQPGTSWPAHGLHDARRLSGTTVWIGPQESRTATLALTVGG